MTEASKNHTSHIRTILWDPARVLNPAIWQVPPYQLTFSYRALYSTSLLQHPSPCILFWFLLVYVNQVLQLLHSIVSWSPSRPGMCPVKPCCSLFLVMALVARRGGGTHPEEGQHCPLRYLPHLRLPFGLKARECRPCSASPGVQGNWDSKGSSVSA